MPPHLLVPGKVARDPGLNVALGTARVDITAFREKEGSPLAHREIRSAFQSNMKLVGPMHDSG
jgi:hypothetical protein